MLVTPAQASQSQSSIVSLLCLQKGLLWSSMQLLEQGKQGSAIYTSPLCKLEESSLFQLHSSPPPRAGTHGFANGALIQPPYLPLLDTFEQCTDYPTAPVPLHRVVSRWGFRQMPFPLSDQEIYWQMCLSLKRISLRMAAGKHPKCSSLLKPWFSTLAESLEELL